MTVGLAEARCYKDPMDAEDDVEAAAETWRVLLVDDHEIVRAGLAATLGQDPRLEIVGLAADPEEALTLVRRTVPQIVIVDFRLANARGDELCRRILDLMPSTSVVMLSSYLTEETVRAALDAGAVAYVTKAAGLTELRAAIDRIVERRGASTDAPAQIVTFYERLVHERVDAEMPTSQQLRVLNLAAEGKTYKQIALELHISESTVRFHIQKLKVKLDAKNKTELITIALRKGLVAPASEEADSGGAA